MQTTVPLQAVCPALVLASGSRTRLALLEAAGLVVQVRPSVVDEDVVKRSARADGAGADDTALLLAELKARGCGDDACLVIGADQILVCDDAWFDKPPDLVAARAHLVALRGRAHVLHTAVCITSGGVRLWQHVARPRLVMRHFSDSFLDAYLAAEGNKLLSSVGAYRMEGLGLNLFAQVDGEQSAILGLPMLVLLGFLREYGALLA